VPHNVTFFSGVYSAGNPDLYGGQFVEGDTVTHTFEDPGVYAYYCTVHPSMLGVVVVGDPRSAGTNASLPAEANDASVAAVKDVQDAPQPSSTELPDKLAGQRKGDDVAWAEAVLGAGAVLGLAVGLVAVTRWRQR
jgi:hypothetical protein